MAITVIGFFHNFEQTLQALEDWEDETARNYKKFMLAGGAFDCETHRLYTNRAALTTYPRTRYMDLQGSNQIEKTAPIAAEVY